MTTIESPVDTVIEALRSTFGTAQLSVSETVREQHGRDESYHRPIPPNAVFFATSTDDLDVTVQAG